MGSQNYELICCKNLSKMIPITLYYKPETRRLLTVRRPSFIVKVHHLFSLFAMVYKGFSCLMQSSCQSVIVITLQRKDVLRIAPGPSIKKGGAVQCVNRRTFWSETFCRFSFHNVEICLIKTVKGTEDHPCYIKVWSIQKYVTKLTSHLTVQCTVPAAGSFTSWYYKRG